ncbi:hypothetical protein KKF05_02250 [Patescibacteria group bacterium]|nr:hypothetical protein [Patescibacteria group bacterium]
MSIKYIKEFARNYSMFQIVAFTEFNQRSTPEFNVVVDVGQPLLIYSGEGLTQIYYPEGGLGKIFAQFGAVAANVDYFNGVVSRFLAVVDEIKPFFERIKSVKNIDELKHLYELYLDYLYGESVVWVAPLIDNLPPETKAKALIIREETQHLTSLRDELFDFNLSKLFPKLKELTHFITPSSVFSGRSNQELIAEANKHQSGFIYFGDRIFIGSQNEILSKLNIELENSLTSEKIDAFSGQAASPGIVEGSVKIIYTNNDLPKVTVGDILVSPMTRPDFLSAMKLAAAFVTDEGGITCHAAIVSREFSKPCIVGTKVATQVLRDGDWVRVDADNGQVNILKKAA